MYCSGLGGGEEEFNAEGAEITQRYGGGKSFNSKIAKGSKENRGERMGGGIGLRKDMQEPGTAPAWHPAYTVQTKLP